jgi:Phosphotransferase enzyme family
VGHYALASAVMSDDDRAVTTLTELWASPAWRVEAETWIRRVLTGQGIRVTGRIEQPRIRVWSTQLTVPTDHGRIWFKENNPGQRAEAAVVAELARIAPDHVVTPLAIEPDRGWLLSPDRGQTFATLEAADVATWELVVSQYAELQRRTVEAGPALIGAGLAPLLPDDVPDHLVRMADRFLREPVQSPLHADADLADRLRRASDTYRPIVAELTAGAVPSAFEHNDLHLNNAFIPQPDERTLRFFDFGDAVWGYPLTSIFNAVDRAANQWRTTEDDPRVGRLVDAYLEGWTDLAPRGDLTRLLELARSLEPVHRLETWRRLLAHATTAEAAPWAHLPRDSIARIAAHADRAAG